MKILNKVLIVIIVLGTMGACDNLELDGLQTNPNAPSPETASLNDLYNNIQLGFNNAYQSAEFTPGASVRMYMSVAYTYRNMAGSGTFNGLWGNAYNGLFPDIDALIKLAEGKNFAIHVGSAKIMKAYVLMILVDLLGSAPNSEALQGTDVISPVYDSGSDIYAAANTLLDEAIAELTATNAPKPTVDIFYNGDFNKWIKFANTLKLRAALNKGDVATINSIITGGNYINAAAEDFAFKYGNKRSNPDSRHPQYTSHYETGDGDYLSNYFMWMLKAEKISAISGNEITDPRIRYYFYRKVKDAAGQDPTTYSCHFSNIPDDTKKPSHWNAVDPRLPYCICSADGYSGRDHLNGEGIPPDGPIRTSYGLYPFGGDFDDDSFKDTRKSGTLGGLGAGISPIMLSSFVSFMQAEAVLRLGASGNARALLETGIRRSLNKVVSFESLVSAKMGTSIVLKDLSTGTIKQLYGMDATDMDNYVAEVLALYDAASAAGKLDIVIKEFYIAAYGNGIEAYNMYRRTGYPGNMEPSLETDPGQFPLSFFYPNNSVDRNASIEQKDNLGVSVFWQDATIASKLY